VTASYGRWRDGLPVTPADVRAAAEVLDGLVVRTPTSVSQTLSRLAGCELVLKFENLQFTASFKERGARHVLEHLGPEERERGVVAASAGNHAQGLAHHAALLGVPALIVMPEGTPYTKVDRTEVLGAEVVLAGADYDEATATATDLAGRRGARLVPAFDDPLVVAGQGTVGLELLADAGPLDVVVVPVGGGGLIAGVALAAAAVSPTTEVVGVQVEGYAGMLAALGRAEPPTGGPTIADGIAVREPGLLTRRIVEALVADLVVVTEDATEGALAMLLEIEKTVVEGAGAVGLAAVLEDRERFAGRRVGVVLSGGNIDLRVLSSVILLALARSGRLHRLSVDIPDRPGLLAEVAGVVAAAGGNIIDVEHRRDLPGLALRRTMLDLSMETRNEAAARAVVDELERRGYRVTVG
jgi:threonine dehydratase